MVDISAIYTIYLKLGSVSTDTRRIKPADMFFALKGPNFNGNHFVQQALDAGAAYCVVDEKDAVISERHCILVSDAQQTLQDLASLHRSQLHIPVIAVAGSNGKTTSKELIGAVLNKRYKTFSTEGNLNNYIGVPLSILSIKPDIEIAVLEIGANHVGETERLCRLAQPTHGLVTNNGKDHLEGYGSIENVRKGNGELFEHLRGKGGTAFVSTLQPDLLEDTTPMRRYTYGTGDAHVRGRVLGADPFLKICYGEAGGERYDIQTKLTGTYNFENVMAAVAVGMFFAVDETDIVKAIVKYKPSNNRSQYLKHKGNAFIVDCYNANPSSMQVALQSLYALEGTDKKMAVLGDMFELGEHSDAEHLAVVRQLESYGFDRVLLVGPAFAKAQQMNGSNNAVLFTNVLDAKAWFENEKPDGYTVLLKGSRGMALEKLVEK